MIWRQCSSRLFISWSLLFPSIIYRVHPLSYVHLKWLFGWKRNTALLSGYCQILHCPWLVIFTSLAILLLFSCRYYILSSTRWGHEDCYLSQPAIWKLFQYSYLQYGLLFVLLLLWDAYNLSLWNQQQGSLNLHYPLLYSMVHAILIVPRGSSCYVFICHHDSIN